MGAVLVELGAGVIALIDVPVHEGISIGKRVARTLSLAGAVCLVAIPNVIGVHFVGLLARRTIAKRHTESDH